MNATCTEIANDVFRINIEPEGVGLSFSCFLIRDEQPAMVETGFDRTFGMFDLVYTEVQKLIDPSSLRYIFIPHFEGDECGSINRFLELAPQAEVLASPVAANVTLGDYVSRPVKPIGQGEKVNLGHKTLSAVITPWVHVWDSMLVHDETDRVLFTSDLFGQYGYRESITSEDRSQEVLDTAIQSGLLPSQKHLERALDRIEPLAVDVLACHHGSLLAGDPNRYYKAMRDNQVGDILDAPFYEMKL
jgi:flavorubredoxin